MPNYLIYLILTVIGGTLAMAGVMVGAWLMFKGKSTIPNEPFIGTSKERGAFSINVDDSEEFPGAEERTGDEKRVLAKTTEFLEKLGG